MSATLDALRGPVLEAGLAAGLRLRVGPFNLRIRARDPDLPRQLAACYPGYRLAVPSAYAHAGVDVTLGGLARLRRRGRIRLDDGVLFTDYAAGHALPYVEWALNWCVATRCHFLLMLHAAVVEKRGRAVLLPGIPGAGKSTLCAYLVHHGWRLLSDEFCLLRPGTTDVIPFPRLIPLKNEAIDVIAEAAPAARIGPRFEGTRKGTVAHVTPPEAHARSAATAAAALVVKPQYATGAATILERMAPSRCFVELSRNAFNYQVLGRAGFETVAALTETAPAFELRYGDLALAAARLEALLDEHEPSGRGRRAPIASAPDSC